MTRWKPRPEWEAQILDQLDEHARVYDFPMFDNAYFDTAEMRLSAFRADDEWLIVSEQVAVTTPYGALDDLCCYGNQVLRRGSLVGIELEVELPAKPPIPLWGPEREESARRFREIVAEKPGVFYRDDEALVAAAGRASSGLALFLRLDGWHNPDLADDELPSQVECVRSLAGAIARGDPDLYECPQQLWNTDWPSRQRYRQSTTS